MNSLTISLYIIVVIIASFQLFKKPLTLSLYNYLLFIIIIYHGIGFIIYYYSDNQDSKSIIKIASILTCGLVFLSLGSLVAKKLLKIVYIYHWSNGSIIIPKINTLILYIIILAILSLSLVELIFRGKIYNISMYDKSMVLSGEIMEFRLQKAFVERDIIDTLYVYICQLGFGAFIALFAIARAYVTKTAGSVILATLMTATIILVRLSDLHKAPSVYFILQIILLFFLCRYKKIHLAKTVSVAFLFLTGMLIIIYLILTTAENPIDALGLILLRITYIPNYCLDILVSLFPDFHEHKWGMNIRMLHNIFGDGEFIPVHLDEKGSTANAIFLADAWIDFSWFGVIVFSFILGYMLTCIDKILFEQKDILRIAIFVGLLGPVHALASTSLITSMFGMGFIPIILSGLLLKKI